MANPRYGQVAQSRGSDASAKGKGASKGASASVYVKQAFTGGQLPGKASNWYKVKGPKVYTHASSKGLC